MRGSVNAGLVDRLARLAGYEFFPKRCQELAPQLEWILAQAAQIERFTWTSDQSGVICDFRMQGHCDSAEESSSGG